MDLSKPESSKSAIDRCRSHWRLPSRTRQLLTRTNLIKCVADFLLSSRALPPNLHVSTKSPRGIYPPNNPNSPSPKTAPDGADNTAGRLHEKPTQQVGAPWSESITLEGSSTARTLTLDPLEFLEYLPIELREHLTRLKLIAPAITVSIIALNVQNAEQDLEIASVLSSSACAPLDDEIEHLEEILKSRAADSPAGGGCMKPLEVIPGIRTTAVAMLPGLRHARALLDVSIRVLEYFANYAEKDAKNSTAKTFRPPPPELQKEVESASAMLSVFARLH